jgi:subtilisin family serine protease
MTYRYAIRRVIVATTSIVAATGLLFQVPAGATETPVAEFEIPVFTGAQALSQYLIALDESVTDLTVVADPISAAGGTVTDRYDSFNTLAAVLTSEQAAALASHPSVMTVEQDRPIDLDANSDNDGDSAGSAPEPGPIPGRYIITLERSVNPTTRAGVVSALADNVIATYRHAIDGYAVELTPSELKAIKDLPGIANIESDAVIVLDQIVSPGDEITASGTQTGAPWGLDRTDQVSLPLDGTYTDRSDGTGVTAYIIDTGIAPHSDFGERLVDGRNFYTSDQSATDTNDCNGHGTHVAGSVAGRVHGLAKGATVVPVRVFGCSGSTSTSIIISAIDWVVANHTAGTPAVANMSLGGGASSSLDAATRALVADGIIIAVAAGNSNQNACYTSPAREPQAITVAASTSSDARASFSNFGSCVDLFAPGQSILSAWPSDVYPYRATHTISGTSMASPHVAGAAAVLWGIDTTANSEGVTDLLLNAFSPDKISNPGTDSPNRLLHISPGDGTPPSSPTDVSATLVDGNVTINWTAPTDSGSGDIIAYTAVPVTANGTATTPTCTWSSGPLQCRINSMRSGTWRFAVRASNQWGTSELSDISNEISIDVTNDEWAGARLMADTAGSLTDSNSGATWEPGEPTAEYGSGTATKWFRFSPTSNGSVTIDTRGSDFDTVLGVYTGGAVDALTQRAANDDASFDGVRTLQSRVAFTVTAGTDYWVRINSYWSTTGTIALNWDLEATCTPGTVPNDNLCAASAFNGTTDNDTVDTTYATVEADEPGSGSRSLWYTYSPDADGQLTISRSGLAAETWIDVYTGTTIDSLVAHPDWTPLTGTTPTSGTMRVDDKTTYLIRHATDTAGSLTTAIEFVADAVVTEPTEPTLLTVTEDQSGTNPSIIVNWGPSSFDGGSPIISYEVATTPADDSCSVTGGPLTCTLDQVQQWKEYTVSVVAVNAVGQSTATTATIVLGNSNDMFADAAAIEGDVGTTYSSNSYATSENGEPAHRFGPFHSMWFAYTAPSNGELVIDTAGSNYDTTLAAYTGSRVEHVTKLDENDDASFNGFITLQSRVTIDVAAGTTYHVAVDGYAGRTGAITLNWTLTRDAPPDAPTSVRAVATGTDRAVVAWTNPDNALTITSAIATASPSGATCTTSGAAQCIVSGLTAGETYTFTVTVANSMGTSPASEPSDPITIGTEGGARTTFPGSWGLDRIDETDLPMDGLYSTGNRGDGVIIFVVDTGISPHSEFGDRLLSGHDTVGDGNGALDCHGHGTHVASTSAGSTFGVADDALLVGVRVLDCGGGGTTSGVVAGLDWVADYDLDGMRGVVNMSLGGGASSVLDAAVARLVDAGITVAVAAGNEAQAACNVSPAREPSAITVGATDRYDSRAWFSNYGSCVDIFAPGVDITGAGIGSTTDTDTMSGTSMASPHVAGAAAIVLSAYPSLTPAEVSAVLAGDATRNVISGPGSGSPNLLLMVAGDSLPVGGFPSSPKDVTATPGDSRVTVSWTPGSPSGRDVATFVVTGSPTGSCSVDASDQTSIHSCDVTGLVNGVEYAFAVTAIDTDGVASPLSAAATATPVAVAPPVEGPRDDDNPAPTTTTTTTTSIPAPTPAPTPTPTTTTIPAPTPTPTPTTSTTTTIPALDLESTVSEMAPTQVDEPVITPVRPERMVDTRRAASSDSTAVAKVGGSRVLELPVLGQSGVPESGVAAVAMNVTVTDAEVGPEGGYLTVFPCGERVPNVSNLNFVNGQTVANSVIAPVSDAGTVCFYVYGEAHVLADISGVVMDGAGFRTVEPERRVDTRSGLGDVAAVPIEYSVLNVPMLGRAGVPERDVTAVSINLTVTNTVAPEVGGYATVYPCDAALPDASNLNFTTGATVPNSVISPLSADGHLCVFVYGSADIIIDVNGAFDSGVGYGSIVPARLADTRSSERIGNASGTGDDLVVQVSGIGGVPSDNVISASLNITVVDTEAPDAGGYVTVYPCGTRPDSSTLNFTSNQVIANALLAPLSDGGTVCVHVFGSANVIVDVNGYITGD